MTDVSRDLAEVARTTRLALSAWHSPTDFTATVQTARDQAGPHVIFRTPAWSFWRDAWTLGRFAQLSSAERVQLTSAAEQYPDGRVQIGSEILDVEVTEAMMPDRRRANEYAPTAPRMRHDPVEEWDRRLDELPKALERVIGKKVEKLYGQKPTLLVYLNIGAYDGYREEETRGHIAAIKGRYATDFRSLHVLWGNELL